MKTAFALLICLSVATAHICLLSPLQRGGASDATVKPAVPACFHAQGCAGTSQGPPLATFQAGSMTTVTFVKNLDHHNQDNPGNFTIRGFNGDSAGPILATVTDSDSPSLSIYSVSVFCPPETVPGNYSLQAAYYPNNPKAPTAFYACADVQVV